MDEQTTLTKLNFPEPYDVQERSSIADLYKPGQRCGIYVLCFETGELYAGKAVDVTRRFCQHRQTHGDIIGIYFKQIPEENLDTEERKVIWMLEERGFRLRNIALTSIPKGESDFDQIMSATDQHRWLHDFNFVDDVGSRVTAPDLRRKYVRKYEKLMKEPLASEVIQALHTYVQLCIPAVRRGELDFWSVSCLPGPGKDVYARVNIYWLEVCTVTKTDHGPVFYFHMAKSPIRKLGLIEKIKLYSRHRVLVQTLYRKGGHDQIQMYAPLGRASNFIKKPPILASIRLFNLRLMKMGPNNNARSHCLDLADALV